VYAPWQELRPWTLADQQVPARLKSFANGRVILELENGETLNTSESALTDTDRQWIRNKLRR
jgi:hypothetical protein